MDMVGREAQGLTHPSRRPSTDRQHACGAVRHAHSVLVSVRWREAHRHGNHPIPIPGDLTWLLCTGLLVFG